MPRSASIDAADRGRARPARPVPPALTTALGAARDSTVIEVIRVYRLQSGKAAEVAVSLYPPDRFSMTMKMRSKRT